MKKNVILLTIDTLRKDVLGIYGSDAGLTPFVDSLKDKCIKFTKAHTVAPYTQASFPGILTSSYYFDQPVSKDLSPNRTLVSEVLKKAGIVTGGFHSNAYLCEAFGWNRGWDMFYDSMEDDVTDYEPFPKGDVINSNVASWLSSLSDADRDKSIFLWAHYMDVHEPYIPDQKYVDVVDSSISLNKKEMFALFTDVLLQRDVSNKEQVDVLRKLYLAHVLEMDDHIKSFFEILEKHNLLDDSVVIITTDHGDEFGEHKSLSHDGKFFTELVGSPLLIYDKSAAEGVVCDKVVSGLDVSPTVLNLFGLDPEPSFQGQSLLPIDSYEEKGCYGECTGKLTRRVQDTDKPTFFYRNDDLKIIYRQQEDQWQMYDLDSDPQELDNTIDSHPEAQQMKSKLQTRIDRPSVTA